MKNQDMPARPSTNWADSEVSVIQFEGETKFEKAFWQMYSSMVIDPELANSGYDSIADYAIEAVNAGFKALENRNG